MDRTVKQLVDIILLNDKEILTKLRDIQISENIHLTHNGIYSIGKEGYLETLSIEHQKIIENTLPITPKKINDECEWVFVDVPNEQL